MKKSYFFILLFLTSTFIFGQRGIKIGYIDTEYILENLPEYNQISKRLEEKAGDWKKEIEERSRKIDQKKESLKSERILLTSEMIEEIEEEILIDEEELSEYQQKRFGPRGDLIIQKQQLIQPIQDQIFNAIRELAKSRNYDFIFDKSADIVMLYSDKRYDVSDQILRTISRANNRKKVDSRKDKREIENESLNDKELKARLEVLSFMSNDNIIRAEKYGQMLREKNLDISTSKRDENEEIPSHIIDLIDNFKPSIKQRLEALAYNIKTKYKSRTAVISTILATLIWFSLPPLVITRAVDFDSSAWSAILKFVLSYRGFFWG